MADMSVELMKKITDLQAGKVEIQDQLDWQRFGQSKQGLSLPKLMSGSNPNSVRLDPVFPSELSKLNSN
jgi:hypothetical protein